jgi:putative thymidine phosphorylase
MNNMNNNSHENRVLQARNSIQKKLVGKNLSSREIFNVIDLIAQKKLSNTLIAYFTAASFKGGFSDEELYYFVKAMVDTGQRLKFSGIVADKHSTGGLAGTRTTLIVVPIIAAAGFKIPKISSRAITTPAGTADVMEVFAKVDFNAEFVEDIVNRIGGCIVWNNQMKIAPADDIIIRVEEELNFESFDKIIISILAKKIAASSNHIIFDIPYGPTMKIRRLSDAKLILDKFTELGKRFNLKIAGYINYSFEPAGFGVGPLLEARDALSVLEQRKDRPLPLEEKALILAGKLLDLCISDDPKLKNKVTKSGTEWTREILQSGAALKKFREIVAAQGGNQQISTSHLKLGKIKKEIYLSQPGRIWRINNRNLNAIAKILGAPKVKEAGIFLFKKTNDFIKKDEPAFIFYSSSSHLIKEAEETLANFPIYEIK